MRILSVCLLFVACLFMTASGCAKKSEPGGGAVANFNVSGPMTATTVPKGKSETVTLTLKPSKNFHQTVKLDAKPLDDGVKPILEQKEVKLDGTNKEVHITVEGNKKVAAGKSTVRVTATPEKGDPATLELSFVVKDDSENESANTSKGGNENTFDLSGPKTSTTVAQGERTAVDLTLKPVKNVKQTVKLQARAQEAGLKAMLSDAKVPLDAQSQHVKLNVEAQKDAKPGTYSVHVTATPERGEPKAFDVSITVKEKK
jgi:hypothetical protein